MDNTKSNILADLPSLARRKFIKTSLAGAGLAAAGTVVPSAVFAQATKQFTFGSASSSGAWYPLSVVMSKVISDNVEGVNVTGVTTPGASRENILRIDAGEMELGWSLANTIYSAYTGQAPFDRKMAVSGWFSAYPAINHIVARKGSGIKSFADMRGKRVATGTPGSQSNIDNEQVLFPAHGLTPEVDFDVERISFTDAVQKMIDGHIDACAYYMGAGVPGFNEMAETIELEFIPVEPETIAKMQEGAPTIYADALPAGTYKGQAEPISAVHIAYALCCSPELDDDFMYEATKAVWENYDFVTTGSAVFKKAKIENVFKGLGVPMHPGAARYFAEHGVTA